MAIHTTVAELIGNTPLVELHNVTDGVRAKIAVKVEYFNPAVRRKTASLSASSAPPNVRASSGRAA